MSVIIVITVVLVVGLLVLVGLSLTSVLGCCSNTKQNNIFTCSGNNGKWTYNRFLQSPCPMECSSATTFSCGTSSQVVGGKCAKNTCEQTDFNTGGACCTASGLEPAKCSSATTFSCGTSSQVVGGKCAKNPCEQTDFNTGGACCKAYTRPTPPCPIGWYKDQKTDAHPTGDGLCHMKCPGKNGNGEFAQSRTDDSSCKCGLAEPNKQCWGYVAAPAEADVGINPFKCVDNADGVGGICRPK